MTREMHNVSMLTDKEITIEGETYSLEKGDIVALSFKTARNYVNSFGIADFVGRKYPVVDEEYEETVGPTGDTADGLKDENPSAKSGEDDGESEDEDDYDGEVASEAYIWLDDRTVDEVEKDVEEIEDVDMLTRLYDEAERKGAAEAAHQRLQEVQESESDDADADEEQDEE